MPRRSSRRKVIEEEEAGSDEEEIEALNNSSQQKRKSILEDSDDEQNEGTGGDDEVEDDEEIECSQFAGFSSQAPEMTQEIIEPKESERTKLMEMSDRQRDKAISDLCRLVLFKSLAGESIDRVKCIKDAGLNEYRVSNALFDEVNIRLENCFGFKLNRAPTFMDTIKSKAYTKAMRERYYMTSIVEESGVHSKAIHSVHEQSSIEKALLMIVLALAYCKGDPRNDGTRWIQDKDLYMFLNRLDENIPAEPPAPGSKRSKASISNTILDGGTGAAITPDVDGLLNKFVHRDYLLREKASDHPNQDQVDDENALYYCMGPRSMIEIGRRQIIYFCSETMDEDPDPTMLQELEATENEEEEMEIA